MLNQKQNTETAVKTALGISSILEILSNFWLKMQTSCYEQWETVNPGEIPGDWAALVYKMHVVQHSWEGQARLAGMPDAITSSLLDKNNVIDQYFKWLLTYY